MQKRIPSTRPFLSDFEEFSEIVKEAWDSGFLTNSGPLLQRLELALSQRLNVDYLTTNSNGTIAMHLAIKALRCTGEIITTPFSWIATCNAIQWEHCTPVFVDIDPFTFNMNPSKIEAAITPRTTAILPVHVFSNPCEIEAIQDIADKHHLKVIYDGAHCMFVDYKGKALLSYGDISTTSFHATKIFNTAEGGACIASTLEYHERLKQLRFFGFDDKKVVQSGGTNAKMTEIQAALGLANLKYIDDVLAKRKEIYTSYQTKLQGFDSLRFQKINPDAYNYTYVPILFDTPERTQKVYDALQANNIAPRRYFHPSLNLIKAIRSYQPMPIAENIAQRILCLPSYHKITEIEINRVVNTVKSCL